VRVLGEEGGRAALLAGSIEGDSAQAFGLRGGRGLMKREGRVGCADARRQSLQMRRGQRALAVGALLRLCADAGGTIVLMQQQRASFRGHLAVMLCTAAAAGRQR